MQMSAQELGADAAGRGAPRIAPEDLSHFNREQWLIGFDGMICLHEMVTACYQSITAAVTEESARAFRHGVYVERGR